MAAKCYARSTGITEAAELNDATSAGQKTEFSLLSLDLWTITRQKKPVPEGYGFSPPFSGAGPFSGQTNRRSVAETRAVQWPDKPPFSGGDNGRSVA